MTVAVHQLLPVYSVGDAIGGAVQRMRTVLREAGFASDVFAERWDHRLEARAAAELPFAIADGDAVIYHLSIGSEVATTFASLPARRIMLYHNITPTQYYEGTSDEVALWLDRGRADLRRLVPRVELVLAPSEYSLAECRAVAPTPGAVVPLPVDLARLRPRASDPASPPEILAVGRIAPNKRLDTLLCALAALHATGRPDVRLRILGAAHDTGTLLARLRRLADDLGVAHAVEMPGMSTADGALGDAYARAAVLAAPSEHEGFCVPLVEAMAFDLPIVAAGSSAIPGTLGGAGLLVDDRDPLVWAACLERAIADATLRAELVARGRERLRALDPAAAARALRGALATAGVRP